METNEYGLTWKEWADAARVGYELLKADHAAGRAWKTGEDPTDWREWGEQQRLIGRQQEEKNQVWLEAFYRNRILLGA